MVYNIIMTKKLLGEHAQKYLKKVQQKIIELKRRLPSRKKLILYGVVGILLLLILIPVITYFVFVQDIQTKERILNRNAVGVTLADKTGKPFFTFYQPKKITYTPLSNIPIFMQHAAIAAEDRDFYTNPGFSIRGIARAVRENFQSGSIVQGGSTITQELVKIALLNSERNFFRKYQELILAIELSRRYSKNDILELYLNSVYFGEGAFGIENASQAYFGIPAKHLTLAQSALLAGLLPAPSAYSPLSNNPAIAKMHQERIIDTMQELDYVTKKEATAAKEEPLAYSSKPKELLNVVAPHFALMVKNELIKKYGEETVIRSGFKVKTTLNLPWQIYAEAVVKQNVQALSFNNVSNGAAVVIAPQTGEIAALVGSIGWENTEFGTVNMATTPRQPGSSFKPIIYADAIQERLVTAATLLEDKPLTFADGYKPQNYDKQFRGFVTVRQALANSLNIPAIEVMEKVGVQNGVNFAQNMGITSLSDTGKYGLPLVLGTAEVKLLDLTNAYATFANAGKLHSFPALILEIKDKYNKTIFTYKPETKTSVGDGSSFIISSILSDNAARTPTFGGLLTISRPAAVKTGTTNSYIDSLTVGYTPNLAIGVWVGNNDHKPMDSIAGSTGAAPIWRSLMNQFLLSLPNIPFKKPASVVTRSVCPFKGLPDTNKYATQSAYPEYFLFGDAPKPCAEPSPTPTITPTKTPDATPTNTPAPTSQPTTIPTNTPAPTSITPTDILPTLIPSPTI